MVLSRSPVFVRVAALLALAVSLVLPRPVLAADDRDNKAQARAEVAKATLHYKLGGFEEALAAYTRAYELFDAPAPLFNIAQCHKNLRNHERAISSSGLPARGDRSEATRPGGRPSGEIARRAPAPAE